jgi:predicted transposase/invertase (TIGR01784 family)
MGYEHLMERYVNFYTDFAFKKFFGTPANQDLLISFLNALLDFKGENQIKEITYLNSEQLGSTANDRRAVYDVYCKTEKGERFIVEMQRASQQNFKDRSLYYSSFPMQDEGIKGKIQDVDNPDKKFYWDYELHPIYVIGILNFYLPGNEQSDRVITNVYLKDDDNNIFNPHLRFVYVEMPKFIKTEDKLDGMCDKWLFAMKNLYRLANRPDQLFEKIFQRLFEIAEVAKYNPQELGEYRESLKNYRDYYNTIDYAKTTAEAKGMKMGMEMGLAEGRAEGRAEGELQAKLAVARSLKAAGVDISIIANSTGLTPDEIAKI